MLYYEKLNDLIFVNYPKQADELKVLSGYIGPTPIIDLKGLPIKCTVIFGLFYENQKKKLHDEMCKISGEDVKVFYPSLLSHSKCYVWLKDGKPIKALIGSANFSSNGLRSDFRETLCDVSMEETERINDYIDLILQTSKECSTVTVNERATRLTPRLLQGEQDTEENFMEGVVYLDFYDRYGNIPERSGINWCCAPTSHVSSGDGYIGISAENVKLHPEIFKVRKDTVDLHSRYKTDEVIELIWDDGQIMQAQFEGTRSVGGLGDDRYPKQLASFPQKSILGIYIRKRLGIDSPDSLVTKSHMQSKNIDSVKLTFIEEGVFSAELVKNHQ